MVVFSSKMNACAWLVSSSPLWDSRSLWRPAPPCLQHTHTQAARGTQSPSPCFSSRSLPDKERAQGAIQTNRFPLGLSTRHCGSVHVQPHCKREVTHYQGQGKKRTRRRRSWLCGSMSRPPRNRLEVLGRKSRTQTHVRMHPPLLLIFS